MARLPLLERAFGQDRLARLHRLVGFTSFNLMLRPRRHRSPGGTPPAQLLAHPRQRSGTSPSTTPACCSRSPARSAWSWSWSPASRRRAAGCATSPGTCCTSTPTSASASRCRTSSGPASSSSPRPPRPCSGGRAWALAAGAVLVWRLGAAAVAQPAAPAAGHLGRPRGRRRLVGLPDRPTARPRCGSRPGQFFTWRFLDRPGLDPRQPVLAVRGPRRPQPADHREGRRRRQRRAPARCVPAPGCWSRARTAGSAPGPAPAAGSR